MKVASDVCLQVESVIGGCRLSTNKITEVFKILILLGKKAWCPLVDDLRTALSENL